MCFVKVPLHEFIVRTVICIFKTENNFVVNSERGTSIFVDNDLLGYKLSCCSGFGLFFSFAQNAFDPTVPG